MGLEGSELENILGYKTYRQKYGRCPGFGMPDLLSRPEEFEDWLLVAPFAGEQVQILCCPEDHYCTKAECTQTSTLCKDCQIPMCNECRSALAINHTMPVAALSNDMMIFYAPKEIYELQVTVVEMICASVCITAMICCTLDMKYRKENPLDSELHMARHRMGARGNATSFPLPWESLLNELMQLDANANPQQDVSLPWSEDPRRRRQ